MAFSLSLLFLAPVSFGFGVVLDPGHGGSDHGAVYGGLTESDIALRVAQRTAAILRDRPAEKSPIVPHLTREKDTNMGLPERVATVRSTQSQVFISVHANSAPDRRAQGTEIYFENHLPPDDDTLLLAAREVSALQTQIQGEESDCQDVQSILADLRREGRLRASRGLAESLRGSLTQAKFRQAPFFVLANNPVASVLVEVGYLSNPIDAQRLGRPEVIEDLAQKLASGIEKFRRVLEK